LSRNAAALSLHADVEARRSLRDFERLAHDLQQTRTREIFFDRLLIDRDDALTERELDAGHGAFAATRPAELFGGFQD